MNVNDQWQWRSLTHYLHFASPISYRPSETTQGKMPSGWSMTHCRCFSFMKSHSLSHPSGAFFWASSDGSWWSRSKLSQSGKGIGETGETLSGVPMSSTGLWGNRVNFSLDFWGAPGGESSNSLSAVVLLRTGVCRARIASLTVVQGLIGDSGRIGFPRGGDGESIYSQWADNAFVVAGDTASDVWIDGAGDWLIDRGIDCISLHPGDVLIHWLPVTSSLSPWSSLLPSCRWKSSPPPSPTLVTFT